MAVATESDEVADVMLNAFSVAESAAEEAIEAILNEGGRKLYQAYIAQKSFTFASEAAANLLVREMKMCFVRHDPGEGHEAQSKRDSKTEATSSADVPAPAASDDRPMTQQTHGCMYHPQVGLPKGWALEPEPPRCRVDTWARACVPVRKKLVRPKNLANDDKKKTARTKASTHSGSARSNSRVGTAPTHHQSETTDSKTISKNQMIPLHEDREEDEEEAMLRDMKERESKRKLEEEVRLQRKAADEAVEAQQLAQVKDQMKNKPFTYDSTGNVVWVQPLNVERLPAVAPVPNVNVGGDKNVEEDKTTQAPQRPGKGAAKAKATAKKKEPQLVDGFKKFASQQPSMMEAMTMSEGVQLNERGKSKSGPKQDAVRSGGAMSRKDYTAMVETGAHHGPQADEGGGGEEAQVSRISSARDLQEVDIDPGEVEVAMEAVLQTPRARGGGVIGPSEGPTMKVVRAPDFGANLVPQPPRDPRPVAPVLPNVRRMQMKRDALGYMLSTRDRIPTSGTGAGFPMNKPQPVLGATMGHGLLPASGQKYEDYYFPDVGNQLGFAGSEPEDPALYQQQSAPDELGRVQGRIENKNPEIARRLAGPFPASSR